MNLSIDEIAEINQVQLNIFKSFVDVCDKLKLRYFMAHGSLLGAVRFKGFFPGDDDIDVLMFRKDYEILLGKGQFFLPSYYFIQSNKSEKEYPLAMAKIRDSRTTYIQDNIRDLNINKGVYIDIFPLDYEPESKIKKKIFLVAKCLLGLRISSLINSKRSFKVRLASFFTKLLCPSFRIAVILREKLFKSITCGNYLTVYSGKSSERMLPFSWFKENAFLEFENLNVSAPCCYKEYLNRIYKDYLTYSPVDALKVGENQIKMNASKIDLHKSYQDFI